MSEQTLDSDGIVDAKTQSALLSGLGFYKLSARRRKQLAIAFGAAAIAHVVALLALGGWVVMRSRREEVTVFRTPPPAKRYEPRKLEHRVKVQKRQRSSSRPAVVPRLVSMKVSDLALPEIKVDPKIVNTTFQPKFKAVTGKGLGAGLGTGYGTAGFGSGVSAIDFFGIHAKGERIAILVDVSVSMVEEERGGVVGYMRVKQRVSEVIDALQDGTLFNLIVFADAASTMSDEMMHATEETRNKAKMYLRPFNMEGNWGHDQGNVSSSTIGVASAGGTTRLDLALTAAFQQLADTILVISDGMPMVKKTVSDEMLKEHQERLKAWQIAQAKSPSVAAPSGPAQRVWVPEQPARPARPPRKGPPKEGQPVDRGSPAVPAKPGYWREVIPSGGGPRPPKMKDPGYWTLADFVQHLALLYKALYAEQGQSEPQIHAIGYQIDKEGDAFLRGLSRQYKGQYRRVRSMR